MVEHKWIYTTIGDRKIVIKGVGKSFYQDGFPISLAIDRINKKGAEVSILHVADECLKHGWSEETVLRKLKEEFADDPNRNTYDIASLTRFVWSNYEDQREMIFQYLFGCTTDTVRLGLNIEPLEWLAERV